ncbi:hypothetical protein tb265_06520 [Gemmatimonadetes bacterium T265]|nr:hypothetical protein tb265_06520 [Gemmatimonadetes bacterium T265]
MPEANAHKVDVWNFSGPRSGHTVAAVTNLTSRKLGRYPLLQLDSGETAYLFVGIGKRPRSRVAPYRSLWFYKIAPDGGAQAVGQAAYLTYCQLPDTGRRLPGIHEEPDSLCDGSHPTFPPKHAVTTREPVEMPLHDSGLWVSCVGGCCYSSRIQKLQ